MDIVACLLAPWFSGKNPNSLQLAPELEDFPCSDVSLACFPLLAWALEASVSSKKDELLQVHPPSTCDRVNTCCHLNVWLKPIPELLQQVTL
jgi:hypothetical protein